MVKRNLDDIVFDAVNYCIIGLVLAIVLYPLYFVVIASFSEPYEVVQGNVRFLPRGFSLLAYRYVLENKDVWTGYRNTIFYTVTGTALSLFLTLPAAYVLSKRWLPGRLFLNWVFLFIMYFSGGLIPMYLLIKSIGLYNKPFTLSILGAFSVFNMIITRTYYQTSIPDGIYEAAEIDGAGPARVFVAIALPLSAPIIAVMALYYAVSQWNAFFNAMVFVAERDYMPLQIILRNILISSQNALSQISESADESEILAMAKIQYISEAMKYSLIIIASFPLLVSYTFVQKYFIKGIMIGSLKA
jgi:putative aldouronate transport system permease protein